MAVSSRSKFNQRSYLEGCAVWNGRVDTISMGLTRPTIYVYYIKSTEVEDSLEK